MSVTDYVSASDYLGSKDDRPLANNTRLVRRSGMPLPGGGDCWFCAMFDRVEERPQREHYGYTGADSARSPQGGDPEHLRSHLEERYYVPTLAINALRYIGVMDAGIGLYLGMRQDSETMGDGREIADTVSRALTRYLKARLVPGLAR